jgi:hypothetical protein
MAQSSSTWVAAGDSHKNVYLNMEHDIKGMGSTGEGKEEFQE